MQSVLAGLTVVEVSQSPAAGLATMVMADFGAQVVWFEYGGEDRIRTRAWRGDAQVCHAYYEPISGYEEDEFPSDDVIAEPITMWFAPVEGTNIHVPVRIRTNAGFGGATITARSIQAH